MKVADTKLKKAIIAALGLITVLDVLVTALISPLTKFLVEKYGEKYLGRQIRMRGQSLLFERISWSSHSRRRGK